MWILPLVASLALAKPTCKQELDVLRARVALLEAELEALRAARGPAPDAEREAAAAALVTQLQERRAGGDIAGALAIAQQVARDYADTRAARSVSRFIDELAVVGTPAAPIAVSSWMQGQASYADAPVTLLIFFEEWCPHCRRELPSLAQRAAALRARGVNVVGLTKITKSSTDEGVRAFLAENAVGFPIGKEDGAMSLAFKVTGIPAAALVRDGTVIWRGHPAQLTDERLAATLAAP